MEKPGTRCSKCGSTFRDDQPGQDYAVTIKVTKATSYQIVEYDLCSVCWGIVVKDIEE